MTDQAARKIFAEAASKAIDADTLAKIELAREYFLNPAFRANLEAATWEAAQ
jgi:hypothetical protein